MFLDWKLPLRFDAFSLHLGRANCQEVIYIHTVHSTYMRGRSALECLTPVGIGHVLLLSQTDAVYACTSTMEVVYAVGKIAMIGMLIATID